MRWVLLLVVSFLCVACAKSHDITPATLGYESITPRPDSVFFEVNFSSDVELLEIFWREKNANSFDQVFICALGDDTDFSIEHTISKAVMGLITENKKHSKIAGFGYTASISFKDVGEKKRTSAYLSRDAIKSLLKDKQKIPCKVVVTATGYDAYFTRSLFIPVADVFSALSDYDSLR